MPSVISAASAARPPAPAATKPAAVPSSARPPGCVHRPSIAQPSLPLAQPSLLIRDGERIQVLRRRARIVYPFPQQRRAVDDIDGAFAVLVLVGEIAPQRIVRIQT